MPSIIKVLHKTVADTPTTSDYAVVMAKFKDVGYYLVVRYEDHYHIVKINKQQYEHTEPEDIIHPQKSNLDL